MKAQTWSELFAEYQYPLYRYLFRMCGSREIAEELLQETFYRAMLSLSIQEARQVRAWLYKVARNLYIDWLRKQTSEQNMLENIRRLIPVASRTYEPEMVYRQKEEKEKVAWVMQQLPERMRTILYLREIEDFTYQELATTLELSMDQVKVTLYRAREKFREWEARAEGGKRDGG
ncbi:RNA polymerase subunit sigma [Brevibacillus reuszeri]|uniref:ECF subfamily RNA polymerase sigma-24 subunit n=1 Tax=Brevibacillus reuszeri TaxID=54915 RepID=A0A0K9YJA7_9BACL|nr:RNA polymerase sigma factor [Brevibacillus reuszeri]KNB68741.1 ECF subfamily RNA polymerase sigma-24 subunit [Brevibacillus reuszeri]MED1859039.1 RNA polymerase sigma factor [Brevibacillus reuszeri]GED69257.1 RNA polymerase subunit sigma [Brevibacillus reuszeri]